MKTDDLIHVLGSNLEPVKGTELRNSLLIALAVGGVAALCLVFAVLGMPTDVFGRQYLGLKLVALAFTLGLVADRLCCAPSSGRCSGRGFYDGDPPARAERTHTSDEWSASPEWGNLRLEEMVWSHALCARGRAR